MELKTRIVLRNDSTANWLTNEAQVLLKGEVGIEFLENGKVKMKIGDGTTPWSALPYFGGEESHVYETTVGVIEGTETVETHEQAIARVMGENVAVRGDIAIVKELIAGDKYAYTGYVYNGTNWAAMDGNYNADNVFFSEDITITTAVGNISLNNGSATIPATGKNIKQVFEVLWTKEDLSLEVKTPTLSLSLSPASATQEVGTNFTRPTATVKVTSIGSYQYGSKDASGKKYTTKTDTNVAFTNLKVGFGNNIDNIADGHYTKEEGTFTTNKTVTYTASADDITSVLVTDSGASYTFSAEGHHTASDRYPMTNLGNYITDVTTSGNTRTGTATADASKAEGNIAASTTDGLEYTATYTVSGYRKPFWGYKLVADSLATPTAITSEQVRALGNSGNSAGDVPTTLEVPVGTKQVFFAVKAGVKNTLNITDDNALGAGVACTKYAKGVRVADARGTVEGVDQNPAEYDLWVVNLDGSFGKAGDLQLAWT